MMVEGGTKTKPEWTKATNLLRFSLMMVCFDSNSSSFFVKFSTKNFKLEKRDNGKYYAGES